MTGVYVLLVVLGAATLFGLWRKRTDGRMRTVAQRRCRRPRPSARWRCAGWSGATDDSEPLLVDGHPIEVVDHSVIPAADVLGPADLGQPAGRAGHPAAVLVGVLRAVPGRARVLGDVAAMVPGVVHIEVDAESHLELVRQLDVIRTPTVLVLDSTGRIRTRATGAPRKVDVIAALGEVV